MTPMHHHEAAAEHPVHGAPPHSLDEHAGHPAHPGHPEGHHDHGQQHDHAGHHQMGSVNGSCSVTRCRRFRCCVPAWGSSRR
ncbi:MAG: hypothetical protein K0R30_1810 [Ornithinibacter sp.]|nr:hypothetical protein [Ornithinibacter sp.]